MKRTKRKSNRSGYQALEPRKMLAGDVTVFGHESVLFIRGDRLANQVEVVGQMDGSVEVRGANGTTINGSSDAFVVNNPTGLRANLGRGDDSIFVEGVDLEGRGAIYGGPGSDVVGVYQSAFDGHVLIQTSSGDDSVSIDEVDAGGNLVINTQSGHDTVGIDNSTVDGFTLIWTGSGDDDIGLANSIHDHSAWIFTRGGNDFVGTENLVVNEMTVLLTGSGSDDVFLRDSTFNGQTFAIGGSSRFDNLEVNGSTTFENSPNVRWFEGTDVAGGILQTEEVFSDLIVSGARLGTIAELATLTPELSTLAGALEATGLDAALQGDGPFTVFAPLNSAFEAIADTVAGLTTEQLTDVLLFHVASGEVLASELVTLMSVDTLLGQSVSVDTSSGSVVLNGNATLAATDIRAKNGVVHLLNDVLVPVL